MILMRLSKGAACCALHVDIRYSMLRQVLGRQLTGVT